MFDNLEWLAAILIWLTGLLVPLSLMVMNDKRQIAVNDQKRESAQSEPAVLLATLPRWLSVVLGWFKLSRLPELPDFYNRYLTLIGMLLVYGGTFPLLTALYFDGYFNDQNSFPMFVLQDAVMPIAWLSTLSMLLFGYVMQSDNAFYLQQCNDREPGERVSEWIVNRTFRAISVGQIFPGVYLPMAVPLWALNGAWFYSVWDIVLRASEDALMPHLFLQAAVRLLMAIFVSVMVYGFAQWKFDIYERNSADDDVGYVLKIKSGKEHQASLLVAVAIVSGFMPLVMLKAGYGAAMESLVTSFPSLQGRTTGGALDELNGMDMVHLERFYEEGVYNIHQLAHLDADSRSAPLKSRLQTSSSPARLDDWVDQSQLIEMVDDRATLTDLHKNGINRCSTLAALLQIDGYSYSADAALLGEKWSKFAEPGSPTLRFLHFAAQTHAERRCTIKPPQTAIPKTESK